MAPLSTETWKCVLVWLSHPFLSEKWKLIYTIHVQTLTMYPQLLLHLHSHLYNLHVAFGGSREEKESVGGTYKKINPYLKKDHHLVHSTGILDQSVLSFADDLSDIKYVDCCDSAWHKLWLKKKKLSLASSINQWYPNSELHKFQDSGSTMILNGALILGLVLLSLPSKWNTK